MEHNEVDVTHTVKASEADGRRLIKNVDTGETRWEGAPVVPTKPEKKPKTFKPQYQD